MPIERSRHALPAAQIITAARRLLNASTLCAVATLSTSGRAHVHTAYFAWTSELDIVWLSEPSARHSRNLRANPSAAISVYDSNQTWGESDRGIQLFGSGRELADQSAREAEDLYAERFPAFARRDLGAYRFYRVRPRRMKLFDERVFGEGVFVTATIRRGGEVAWDRTEIYRASEGSTPAGEG
jgi:uncharacterized protein YhbP (UPF0306 family)